MIPTIRNALKMATSELNIVTNNNIVPNKACKLMLNLSDFRFSFYIPGINAVNL